MVPWLAINRLDLNPKQIKQRCYSGRLSDVRGNFPACGAGGWRQRASWLRGSPAAGLSHEAVIPDPEHPPSALSVVRVRGAPGCQGTARRGSRARQPAACGTRLCSHVRRCSWVVGMLTWKDVRGRVPTADKSLLCVCHGLQLPLNAVMQCEVSFCVKFDFNNLII